MQHHFEVSLPARPTDVEAVLTAQPASWIRPFLRLATLIGAAGRCQPRSGTRPWYRLGPARQDGPDGPDGTVMVAFIWWPHLEGDVFRRFHGSFVIHPDRGARPKGRSATSPAEAAVLELGGETLAGIPELNAAVLRALVELIGTAVSAR